MTNNPVDIELEENLVRFANQIESLGEKLKHKEMQWSVYDGQYQVYVKLASKAIKALISDITIQSRIDELKHIDSLTHSFMSTGNDFLYEYKQSVVDERIAELEAQQSPKTPRSNTK